MKIKKIILVLITWVIIVSIFLNIENNQQDSPKLDFVANQQTQYSYSETRNYHMGFNVDASNNLDDHADKLVNALKSGDIIMTIHNPSWKNF